MFVFHPQRSRKFVIPYLVINAVEFAFIVVIDIPNLIQNERYQEVLILAVAWSKR